MNKLIRVLSKLFPVLLLGPLLIVPASTDEKQPNSSSVSFMSRSTKRAISGIDGSIVNVQPRIDWDEIASLSKLVKEKENEQLSEFYNNVKDSRLFHQRHRMALRSLLYRLDSKRSFETFMRKFRQVIRKPTGERDALDFLQYLAPPRTGYSGVLLEGGYVLTTYFAVSNEHMTGLNIHMNGGKTLSGSVQGTYQDFDLALIEINSENLPSEATPLSLDDESTSQETRVGHWAIAVGRGPRPEHLTASRGIVSATKLFEGRFLQTDSFCNYSNTGGALLNIEGEFIGLIRGVTLNNALRAGLNSGVTRAVKPEAINQILPDLKQGKNIRSSFLGVQRSMSGNPERGVRVQKTIDGCSAADAGIQDGDIILSFDNKEIYKWRDLVGKIRRHMPGDRIRVKVKRNGETETFDVELTSRNCMENQ